MARSTNDTYDIALQRTTAAHRGRLGQRSQEWPSVVQPYSAARSNKIYLDVSCARCSMKVLSSQCTIVLPEEGLGYGPVVPFLVCRFALWFRIMKV